MNPATISSVGPIADVECGRGMNATLASCLFLVLALAPARAQIVNKFHITAEEQAACQLDATMLCSSVFPDEDALIACMNANVLKLTPTCRTTFKAGLQRRHM